MQIGYLTAERCGWIKSLMERGAEVRAIFQHATDYGAVIRVTLDGSEPVLPGIAKDRMPPEVAGDDDTGFYPDPEWPE